MYNPPLPPRLQVIASARARFAAHEKHLVKLAASAAEVAAASRALNNAVRQWIRWPCITRWALSGAVRRQVRRCAGAAAAYAADEAGLPDRPGGAGAAAASLRAAAGRLGAAFGSWGRQSALGPAVLNEVTPPPSFFLFFFFSSLFVHCFYCSLSATAAAEALATLAGLSPSHRPQLVNPAACVHPHESGSLYRPHQLMASLIFFFFILVSFCYFLFSSFPFFSPSYSFYLPNLSLPFLASSSSTSTSTSSSSSSSSSSTTTLFLFWSTFYFFFCFLFRSSFWSLPP